MGSLLLNPVEGIFSEADVLLASEDIGGELGDCSGDLGSRLELVLARRDDGDEGDSAIGCTSSSGGSRSLFWVPASPSLVA